MSGGPCRIVCADRAEWLERRRQGLGASDAAAAVGLSKWKTNVALWEEKTGRRGERQSANQERLAYGTQAEEHLRALFILDHPDILVEHHPYDMLYQPERPWLFATLDGELTEGLQTAPAQRKGVLEIKTAEVLRAADWRAWKEQIPAYYYTQVLHQLLATGWDFDILKAQLKGLDGDLATRHYRYERSGVEVDLEWLLEREEKFWRCVVEDRRPALILPEW